MENFLNPNQTLIKKKCQVPCWDLYWKCDKFSSDILRYDSNCPKLHGLSSQEIHQPSENEEVWEKNVIRGMFGTLTIIPVLSSNNCLFWWWKLVSLWYPAATRIVNRIWRTDSYHSFCRYFTPVIMNFFSREVRLTPPRDYKINTRCDVLQYFQYSWPT